MIHANPHPLAGQTVTWARAPQLTWYLLGAATPGEEHRFAGYSGERGWCSTHKRWENTPPEHDGTGPADDDLVWVAVRRRGIDAHRPDGPVETGCGRSMRCGEKLLAGEARAGYQARWCHRCWPDQPGGDR